MQEKKLSVSMFKKKPKIVIREEGGRTSSLSRDTQQMDLNESLQKNRQDRVVEKSKERADEMTKITKSRIETQKTFDKLMSFNLS